MEFRPHARTRTPHQQTNTFATVSQGQHEQPGPPILARLRVAFQRAAAVIDLGFLPWVGKGDSCCLGQLGSAKPAYETLYGLVVTRIPVVGDQILPDGFGIPSTARLSLFLLPVSGFLIVPSFVPMTAEDPQMASARAFAQSSPANWLHGAWRSNASPH
jgi:hypothetical protein